MEIKDIQKAITATFDIDESLLPVYGNNEERFRALRALLIRRVEELAEKDMEKLMWILYRIDVSEKKLHETMQQTPPENFGATIADLIIERQLKKIETRKEFGNTGGDYTDL